jgi:hypothetical protein
MKFRLLILFFFVTVNCFAQIKITGKVVDEKTGEGIEHASVYLNNSSYGTETDAQGKFVLSCTTTGKAELVFSHIVYDKKIQIVEPDAGELLIKLKPLSNNLNEVIIKAKGNSKLDITRWLNLFTLNLIGRYNHAYGMTKIKNPQDIYFNFDKVTNKLNVYAKGPIIIENGFLAYQFKVDLDKFEYSFNNNVLDYTYSGFYENIKQRSYSEKQLVANRMLAYEGSTMHFMRSVFKNNIGAEFFTIAKYSAIRNKEKERVVAIINKKIGDTYGKEESPDISLSRFFSKDTVKYYLDVMKQEDILSFTTKPVDLRSLSRKDRITRTVNLNFTDTLLVNYQKTKLKDDKLLVAMLDVNKNNPRLIKPIYLSSYLFFFKDGGINIQQNGYYSEDGLFMYGDMPERRMAMSLPLDFDPDHPLQ